MKRIWKALAFLATLAGVALAVSTSALAVGGGSGSSGARWGISLGSPTWSGRLTALYPGVRDDAEILAFMVTNAGQARQRLTRVVALIPATRGGDARTAGGAGIRGCRVKWFTVVVDRADRPLPVRLSPDASYRGRVKVTMRDSGTNQDACRGAAPAVSITAG